MQRVRIGLTGLAFVFVLVLLGAVFTTATRDEPAATISGQQASGTAPGNAEAEPKEPLAELGVAPGNADNNKSDAAPGASGAARPPR